MTRHRRAATLLMTLLIGGCALPWSGPPSAHANGVEAVPLNYTYGNRSMRSLGLPPGPGGLVLTEQTEIVLAGPSPESVTARVMELGLNGQLEFVVAEADNDFTLTVAEPSRWAYLLVTARYSQVEYVEWGWTIGPREPSPPGTR